ncbi:MAG: 2-oxoglutarate dehydrogenase complex dihydrolipoyllysine-residue succinyltransferase [Opitutales bacterium]|nr:2-oxoglutarate dehydrogenase complex dihydrolipoyllysine-residue succinyltransferase [Opitutales bacterium]
MATEVKVPALGESISSGYLAKWHVQSGDYVESGQTLFDLETDKVTSEGTAEVSGVIELKVEEGDEVEVGAVIAEIDESAKKSTDDKGAGDKSKEAKEDKEDDSADSEDEDDEGAGSDHPFSPAVRRLAEESGIDPSKVKGSGKDGRVTKGDMLEAIEKSGSSDSKDSDKKAPKSDPSAEKPAEPKAKISKDPSERQSRRKLTPLRRTIANRLVQAQQTTAMLTTFNEVDMKAVMDLRKKHQEAFVEQYGIKLGFMSFFTKAVVHALKAVPAINAQLDGETLIENHYYDIGIAVSTPKGLMVPVIRDCDQLSFDGVESEILAYAKKARDGKIGIDDLQGGVFTITNGGIFGSMLSTPILNTPQSAILGMHTIQERPVVRNGEIVIRPMMYLALSYDHRIVDGKEAVTFLVKVKEQLEDPSRLLFGI